MHAARHVVDVVAGAVVAEEGDSDPADSGTGVAHPDPHITAVPGAVTGPPECRIRKNMVRRVIRNTAVLWRI